MAQTSIFSTLFPPSPTFKPASLPSQLNRVTIITGAASGVGFELAKILYSCDATVYVCARSLKRCNEAIEKIKSETKGPKSTSELKGKLEAMVVDLADLRTVKPAVEAFLAKESRLDVLVHNAGVMTPPKGSKDVHGHDLEVATHCLGPFLLTKLLEPIMKATANSSTTKYTVRLLFVISLMQLGSPAGGMSFDEKGAPEVLDDSMANYMQSKVGGSYLADYFANGLDKDGILSLSVHPGLMRTELQRNSPLPMRKILGLVFKPAVYGAYTELFAGFSPSLDGSNNGAYIIPWGRISVLQDDIRAGMKGEAEGGNGKAERLCTYCKVETNPYM